MFYFIKISELPQHDVIIIDVPFNARQFVKGLDNSISYKYNGKFTNLTTPFSIQKVIGRYQDCLDNSSLIEKIMGDTNELQFNKIIERNDNRGFIRKFNPLIVITEKSFS